MITIPIENYDFFTQLSLLMHCIEDAATFQLAYFEKESKAIAEQAIFNRTSSALMSIRFQKSLALLPDEKRKYCMILTELSVSAIRTLLRIPTLSRIYSMPVLDAVFIENAKRARILSEELKLFAFPLKEEDRFCAEQGERILLLSLEGLSCCRELLCNEGQQLSGAKKLLFKDLADEFSAFYSLCLQFTHCGLLFPI